MLTLHITFMNYFLMYLILKCEKRCRVCLNSQVIFWDKQTLSKIIRQKHIRQLFSAARIYHLK